MLLRRLLLLCPILLRRRRYAHLVITFGFEDVILMVADDGVSGLRPGVAEVLVSQDVAEWV